MPTVTLDTKAINDRASLHTVCQEAFGFPDFYGRNGDAFIDCLSHLDGDMSRFTLKAGETLIVELPDAYEFGKRAPEQAAALLGWIGDVNARSIERGEPPRVLLLPL
jgi:hypothetical protein